MMAEELLYLGKHLLLSGQYNIIYGTYSGTSLIWTLLGQTKVF